MSQKFKKIQNTNDESSAYRLFQNHDLYNSIMTQMGSMMYANFRAQAEKVFNPERLKENAIPTLEAPSEPEPIPMAAEPRREPEKDK